MLPNGHLAIVEDAKLLEYVLNTEHPVGRGHAILFRDLLGITVQNAAEFKAALLVAAREHPATPGKPTPFGRKFEQRLMMEGNDRQVAVLLVWMIDASSEVPRLITAYPE